MNVCMCLCMLRPQPSVSPSQTSLTLNTCVDLSSAQAAAKDIRQPRGGMGGRHPRCLKRGKPPDQLRPRTHDRRERASVVSCECRRCPGRRETASPRERRARCANNSNPHGRTAAAPPRLPPQRLVPPPPTARRPPGSGQGLPRAMRTATACVASVCGGWQACVERRRRAGAPRPSAVMWERSVPPLVGCPLGNVRTLSPIGDSKSSPIERRARSERGRKNFTGVSKQRCEADPSLPHAHRG